MELDYQITHILNNYKINGLAQYDWVKSEIWVKDWDICYLLRRELGINIDPKTPFECTWRTAWKAWKILEGRSVCGRCLMGTYGEKFLNDW